MQMFLVANFFSPPPHSSSSSGGGERGISFWVHLYGGAWNHGLRIMHVVVLVLRECACLYGVSLFTVTINIYFVNICIKCSHCLCLVFHRNIESCNPTLCRSDCWFYESTQNVVTWLREWSVQDNLHNAHKIVPWDDRYSEVCCIFSFILSSMEVARILRTG